MMCPWLPRPMPTSAETGSAWRKNNRRELRHSLGRFLAIVAIVALGVGFFAGLKVAQPAMLRTGSQYVQKTELFDYRLVSTLGLTQEDAKAYLLSNVESEVRHETAMKIKEIEAQMKEEADQKAREVIRQALAEKQNELDEIDRLKQSREDFRSEYKKLLQHFMDDADSVFPQQTLSSAPNGSGAAPAAAPRPAVSAPATPASATGSTVATNASFQTDFGDLD